MCASTIIGTMVTLFGRFYQETANIVERRDKELVEEYLRSLENDNIDGQSIIGGGGVSGYPATFPPRIPDIYDNNEIENYVKNYMTSIWHWSSSISMGKDGFVDNDFKLKGFKNLNIIDASVLPQITRMNPFATIAMLGDYAANKILKNY